MSRRPFVIAHQGASERCPPNTFAAFREAVACGADIIELDVVCTRDGVAVVSHDLTVDRHTDGHGRIADMTFAEIRRLDAGVRFGAQFAGERIPTLDEVLAWARHEPIRLCIEIKGDSDESYLQHARATVELLRDRGFLQPATLTSFDPACIRSMRALEPRLSWALDPDEHHIYTGWELVQQAMACGANFLLHRHDTLTAEMVAEVHHHGFAVWAWTADEPADMRRVIAFGVDGLMTNRPDVLKSLLDSSQW
jgi:glycerophosphoryl diester phosphodiesterase